MAIPVNGRPARRLEIDVPLMARASGRIPMDMASSTAGRDSWEVWVLEKFLSTLDTTAQR